MRNTEQHPFRDFLSLSTKSFLTGVTITPLYLIGYAAFDKIAGIEALNILNGIFCAAIQFPFTFQFLEKELTELPEQWRHAGIPGKLFILTTSGFALLSAGLANCYYMTGNTFFKIIAVLMPAIPARAILADWLLRLNLRLLSAATPRTYYRNVEELLQKLDILSNNLKYNEIYQNSNIWSDLPGLLQKANENPAFQSLKDLKNNLATRITSNNMIKTDFDHRFPNSPCLKTLLNLLKKGGLTGVGIYASYLMYSELSIQAGKCVYGSLLQNDFSHGKISCNISNNSLAHMGEVLGYFNLAAMTGITTFPIFALTNAIWASSNNEKKSSRWAVYLTAFILSGFRSTISVFLEEQNNDNNPIASLIYVASVFFIYNFFTIAYFGPPTIKTISKTITAVCQSAWKKIFTQDGEDGMPLLKGENNHHKELIKNCRQLQQKLLLTPTEMLKNIWEKPEDDDDASEKCICHIM